MDLLLGVYGASFGDDAADRNSIGEEIIAADTAFCVAGVFVAASAEGDDQRSYLLAVKLNCVIEGAVKNGRRVAGVFRCAEDGDGVGWLGVVLVRHSGDLLIDPDAPGNGDQQDHREQSAEKDPPAGASPLQIGFWRDHRCGKLAKVLSVCA